VHDAHAAVPEEGTVQVLEPSGPASGEEPPGTTSSPRIWRHAVKARAAHATTTNLPVAANLSLTTSPRRGIVPAIDRRENVQALVL
jgi:hypothetical protein